MALVGLRASYHRLLGKIEHLLPAKLRPIYNHPAGNVRVVRVPRVSCLPRRIVFVY